MGEITNSKIIYPNCSKENNGINEYCTECGFRLKEKNSKLFEIFINIKNYFITIKRLILISYFKVKQNIVIRKLIYLERS
jgi:hypothetical protein